MQRTRRGSALRPTPGFCSPLQRKSCSTRRRLLCCRRLDCATRITRRLAGPTARHDRSPPPETKPKASRRSRSLQSCIGTSAPSTAASTVDLAVAIAQQKQPAGERPRDCSSNNAVTAAPSTGRLVLTASNRAIQPVGTIASRGTRSRRAGHGDDRFRSRAGVGAIALATECNPRKPSALAHRWLATAGFGFAPRRQCDRRPTTGPIVEAIVRHDDRGLTDAATRAVDASLSLTSGAAVSTSWSRCLFDREHRTGVARPACGGERV
jgi:hypothetical protein